MHVDSCNAPVKIWTFQSTEAVDELLRNGYLECNYSLACKDFRDVQYKWMILQMKKRLGPPDCASAYPLWGFTGDDKPDLRSNPFRRYTGSQTSYLIEAKIRRDRLLLSEYHLWECVLAGWALPRNRLELRMESMALELCDFDEELGGALLRLVPKNWSLIFNPAFSFFPSSLPSCRQIWQAVFWRLDVADVVSIELL